MLTAITSPTTDEPCEQMLHRQIERWTSGRVRHLRVVLGPESLAVHGVSPSYYVKQLVLAAVREVLPATPVDLHIEVFDHFTRAPLGQRGSSRWTPGRQTVFSRM